MLGHVIQIRTYSESHLFTLVLIDQSANQSTLRVVHLISFFRFQPENEGVSLGDPEIIFDS